MQQYAPARSISEMVANCDSVGLPPGAYNSKANTWPPLIQIVSGTPAAVPVAFKIAASIGRRKPPFGTANMKTPSAARAR
jgi:hypothetical protein